MTTHRLPTIPAFIAGLLLLQGISLFGSESASPDTRFLLPGELIFALSDQEGYIPEAPQWKLRKTDWQVKNGILVGNAQDDGNGAFIRLHDTSTDGPLPNDYIMTFSFKATQGGPAKDKPGDPSLSAGHRFSLGHYTAKLQWRRDLGIDLALGHGQALTDDRFHIERDTWYHVTLECRSDEILAWFRDGPSYFLKRDSFLDKTPGWEFFVHKSEIAYLANLNVWSLSEGERDGWQNRKKQIAAEKRSFLSFEHPEFSSEKHK